jgi:hypothetical protein
MALACILKDWLYCIMNLLKGKRLFWEANLDTLDPKKHRQYIIERVFERGTWSDLKELAAFYKTREIKAALKKARWLDEKTMYYVSAYFNIPLKEMRCYTQRQLSPAPWP